MAVSELYRGKDRCFCWIAAKKPELFIEKGKIA
jgi:hypothetical protein